MASADFCAFSAALRLRLRLSARSAQTSPGTTRFFSSIYLPHLPHAIPCSYWASTWYAALPSHIAFYAVPVRQARGLPVVSLFPHPASFRFRLTTDTLAFGYLLPATGRIRVFHPLETCAAGRTQKRVNMSIRKNAHVHSFLSSMCLWNHFAGFRYTRKRAMPASTPPAPSFMVFLSMSLR